MKNSSSKKIIKWDPEDFELEMTSVWSFPKRGNWATHDAKWRGNWSPYIPRNVILRYSKEGEWVLDQFAGGGTTLVEAKLLNRNIIGIDINDKALERCKEKTNFTREGANGKVKIWKCDARLLKPLPDESIDLICTHPPYADIIHYSEGQDILEDLSNFMVDDFLKQIKSVASESYRVLKKGKFCAILMGDTRQKGHVVPLGFRTMEVFENAGFKLKEIIMKEQHNCHATGFWKTNSVKYNFLLLAHEYLFVFRKE
jgi:DNA modification methylase